MWREALAKRLEQGSAPRGPVATYVHRWAERRWSAALCRPLEVPDGVCAIGVGGATLGGSGKTPLAIALCAALAARGHRVALVGHAYGASPGAPRIVTPAHDVREVGDEALEAADALAAHALVVVARSRSAATAFAAARAKVLVFDGLLQTRPQRLARSLLALDADAPWGAGCVPPFGDLRASPDALWEASDAVALLRDERAPRCMPPGALHNGPRPSAQLGWRLHEASDRASGRTWRLEEIAPMRCGVLLGLARPDRILRALARRDVTPVCTVTWADHRLADETVLRRADREARRHRVQVWLTTAKCRTRLPATVASVPVLALRQELLCSDETLAILLGQAPLPS